MLLDSNILIYGAEGDEPQLTTAELRHGGKSKRH